MESDEDDEETQASFCRFLDDNFKLPISAYAPGCLPKVEIKERLNKSTKQFQGDQLGSNTERLKNLKVKKIMNYYHSAINKALIAEDD